MHDFKIALTKIIIPHQTTRHQAQKLSGIAIGKMLSCTLSHCMSESSGAINLETLYLLSKVQLMLISNSGSHHHRLEIIRILKSLVGKISRRQFVTSSQSLNSS